MFAEELGGDKWLEARVFDLSDSALCMRSPSRVGDGVKSARVNGNPCFWLPGYALADGLTLCVLRSCVAHVWPQWRRGCLVGVMDRGWT